MSFFLKKGRQFDQRPNNKPALLIELRKSCQYVRQIEYLAVAEEMEIILLEYWRSH